VADDFRLPELVSRATDSGVEDGEAKALLGVGDVVAGVHKTGDGVGLAGEEDIEFVHIRIGFEVTVEHSRSDTRT
jgi:hypothetical protein